MPQTTFGDRLAQAWQPIMMTVVAVAASVSFYGTTLMAQVQKEVEISRLEVQGYCDSRFLGQADLDRQMQFRDQRLAMLHSKVQSLEKQIDMLMMRIKTGKQVPAPVESRNVSAH